MSRPAWPARCRSRRREVGGMSVSFIERVGPEPPDGETPRSEVEADGDRGVEADRTLGLPAPRRLRAVGSGRAQGLIAGAEVAQAALAASERLAARRRGDGRRDDGGVEGG